MTSHGSKAAFAAPHSTASPTYWPLDAPNNDDNRWFTGYVRSNNTNHYIIAANMDKWNNRGVTFTIPTAALNKMGIANDSTLYTFTDSLNLVDTDNSPITPISVTEAGSTLHASGLTIPFPQFPAHTTLYLELQ